MKRWLLIALGLMLGLHSADCHAQWYGGRYGNYGNYGYGNYGYGNYGYGNYGYGNYGYGNYGNGYNGWYGGYWSGEASTPYSNAVRAQADLTLAQGKAAENYAKAAKTQEEARSKYIENQAKYLEIRRQQKAASDAKREQQVEEAKARAARRPAPKPRTELYPRLSSDELDPLTGEIFWPEMLMGPEYDDDKRAIEQALKDQAEFGPNPRSSQIIFDAAHRMMTTRSRDVVSIGSAGYSSARKFLNSLALEGDHALEDLK